MASKQLVCTVCGYVGEPKSAIEGSGCVEVLLWLFFIIPGLIYSVWRSSSRHKVCPKCHNKSLIPIDSPRAKTIMAESTTKEEGLKKEEITNSENKTETDEELPKYLKWWGWCKKHPIWSIVILLFGAPMVFGMISGIVSPTDKKQTPPPVVAPSKPVSMPTITEILKKANIDPYWTSNKVEDYSDTTKLQVASVIFSSYADDVIKGEKSSSDEDKKLASELRKKLVAKQVKEYPKMRQAYAKYAHDLLWEQDIDVTASGSSSTTLTLVGGIFASNKGIASIENNIEEMLKELRFKRVNYKWIPHDEDYQYFDLKTPSDGELKPV